MALSAYVPVPAGAELFDGANVNVLINAVNAALTAASQPASLQINPEIPGYRLMSGDKFNKISAGLVALGKTTPVIANSQGGLQIGHRLFTGDLLNKMAAQMALY